MIKALAKILICFLLVITIQVFVSQKADASKRIITDMVGRSITINGEVKRIVTSFKPATLCILSLGLQNKLVGVDSSSLRDKLNLAVFPGIKKLSGVGSKSMGLNYESIISLNPDLVILYAQKDGLELAKQFDKIKIPTIIIFPETFASIKTSLRIIAEAAGKQEKLLIAENAMNSILSFVDKKISALPEDKRKTAYFASSRGFYSTATGNMLQDEMFAKAGLINVAHELKGYFQDISPEQFIKWDPEIVAVSRHLKSRVTKKLNNPAIKNVRAVKNKTVYKCPSSLAPWDFPSPLSVLGVLWIAKRAYPEHFKDTDMAKKVNDFHMKLFGKSLEQMGGSLNDKVFKG